MGDFDHLVAAVAELKRMAESNDFSRLDQSAAKRQHFVSQFLLRGFAQQHNGKDSVFQMPTKSRLAPQRVGVRSAASRRRFYAIPDEDGELSNRNEGFLALVEDHAAPALRQLLEDPGSLSPGNRATIAVFVALQTMRTPAAAQQVTAIANAALQSAASEFYSDRDAFADSYREHFGEGASSEEIEAFRQETLQEIRDGRLRLGGRDAALSTGLIHAIDKVPLLIEFDWTLLQATGGFITSDRGYAIHDPTPPYPWAAQGILSSPNSETVFPVNDRACLVLRPLRMEGRMAVQAVSSDEVETINLRMIGWADEYVFGRTQEVLVNTSRAARRRPRDVIRPNPFNQVVLIEPDPEDTSLIEENFRRGWPPQLLNENGEPWDYLVIPTDSPQPELLNRADELTERRARKRAGIGAGESVEGRIISRPVHPLEVSLSSPSVETSGPPDE